MAARALILAAAALGISGVAMILLADLGWAYGMMLGVGALAALALSVTARHQHDAVRMVTMVASLVLAVYGGLVFLSIFGPGSHMIDPGPIYRVALGVGALGFASAVVALTYNLFVEVGRR